VREKNKNIKKIGEIPKSSGIIARLMGNKNPGGWRNFEF
jgi:hypothetical protein